MARRPSVPKLVRRFRSKKSRESRTLTFTGRDCVVVTPASRTRLSFRTPGNAERGYAAQLRRLSEGGFVEISEPGRVADRIAALIAAAFQGRGARRATEGDANRRDKATGKTALMDAAIGLDVETVTELLAARADPKARIPRGKLDAGVTALMLAAEAGLSRPADVRRRRHILQILVRAGSELDAKDGEGRTALRYAVERGFYDAVEALLRFGADPDVADRKGWTPLSFIGRPRSQAGRRLVELLLAAGASPSDLARAEREEELRDAARKGDAAKVRRLLRQGAAVDAAREDGSLRGSSPLQLAAGDGRLGVVSVLLAAGASVDLRASKEELTPLVAAAAGGHLSTVKRLVEAGADLAATVAGRTALDYARVQGQDDVVAFLRSRGAAEESLRGRFGIASIHVNEGAVLVRADLEQVTAALAAVRGSGRPERDIYGRPVRVRGASCVVYQLRGHEWTLIQEVHAKPWTEIGDEDAALLSRRLATRAISYRCSDTAGAVEYALYESGRLLEELRYDGRRLRFRSERKREPGKRAGDAFARADAFLREQRALVPGWSDRARTRRAGEVLSMRDWPRDEIRADCVTLARRRRRGRRSL